MLFVILSNKIKSETNHKFNEIDLIYCTVYTLIRSTWDGGSGQRRSKRRLTVRAITGHRADRAGRDTLSPGFLSVVVARSCREQRCDVLCVMGNIYS